MDDQSLNEFEEGPDLTPRCVRCKQELPPKVSTCPNCAFPVEMGFPWRTTMIVAVTVAVLGVILLLVFWKFDQATAPVQQVTKPALGS